MFGTRHILEGKPRCMRPQWRQNVAARKLLPVSLASPRHLIAIE